VPGKRKRTQSEQPITLANVLEGSLREVHDQNKKRCMEELLHEDKDDDCEWLGEHTSFSRQLLSNDDMQRRFVASADLLTKYHHSVVQHELATIVERHVNPKYTSEKEKQAALSCAYWDKLDLEDSVGLSEDSDDDEEEFEEDEDFERVCDEEAASEPVEERKYTAQEQRLLFELQTQPPPIELPPPTTEQTKQLLTYCAGTTDSNLITFGSATYLKLDSADKSSP